MKKKIKYTLDTLDIWEIRIMKLTYTYDNNIKPKYMNELVKLKAKNK